MRTAKLRAKTHIGPIGATPTWSGRHPGHVPDYAGERMQKVAHVESQVLSDNIASDITDVINGEKEIFLW